MLVQRLREITSIAHAELVHDPPHDRGDCARRSEGCRGDLTVGSTVRSQGCDFGLGR